MHPPNSGRSALLVGLLATSTTFATTSVSLPGWVCTQSDAVFVSRFDPGDIAVPHDPSGGSGGDFPGAQKRTLHIAGLGSGTQNYYLYVPSSYEPSRPTPLLLVLHGVAALGDSEAMRTRDNWATAAESGGFIVAAPVADEIDQCWDGQQYVPCESWLVPPVNGPSDYDLFAALRTDVENAYNIERTRIYGWGFSAGGHVMHDLAIGPYSSAFNAGTMAAYGVAGADLAALACAGYTSAGCDQLLLGLPRKIPVDIHIGNNDPNFPYAKADHLRFLADGWVDHVTVDYSVFVGGHTYTIGQLGEVWNTLCPNALMP